MFGMELYKFILENISKTNFLEENFLLDIKDIVINGQDLQDYIKNIKIYESDKTALGKYNGYEVLLNKELLNRHVNNLMSFYGYKNYLFCRNIIYLNTLLHEIVHAYQFKMMDEQKNIKYSKLMYESFRYLILKENYSKYDLNKIRRDLLYKYYPSIFIHEFNADALGRMYVYEIFNNLPEDLKDQMKCYDKVLIMSLFKKSYKQRHGEIVSPLNNFCKIMKVNKDDYDLSNMSLFERFTLGDLESINEINSFLNDEIIFDNQENDYGSFIKRLTI